MINTNLQAEVEITECDVDMFKQLANGTTESFIWTLDIDTGKSIDITFKGPNGN